MVANFSLKCVRCTVAKTLCVYKQSISGNRKGIPTTVATFQCGHLKLGFGSLHNESNKSCSKYKPGFKNISIDYIKLFLWQGCAKVWKLGGGACSNVVGIICPLPPHLVEIGLTDLPKMWAWLPQKSYQPIMYWFVQGEELWTGGLWSVSAKKWLVWQFTAVLKH